MHALRRICALLVLSLPAQAQFTMPPGFLVRDNTGSVGTIPYSQYFGAYAEGRVQIISADWTFKPAVTMKSLSLRRDSEFYHTAVHGQARSWSNVMIQLAESKWLQSSPSFSVNLRSTPTSVFNAPTIWSDTASKPPLQPMWGDHKMNFVFSTPYYWPRFADACIDFQFSGGTLANAGTWTEANYVMLDGFTDKLRNGPIYNILLTTKCNLPGFFGSAIYANGPNHPRSNTMSLDVFQALGVPNTPFVGAIGVTGSTSGIDFGTCQKLHLLRTSVLFNYTTSASGSWAQPTLYIPFSPSYIGLPVYTQAAFAHPITKAFQLTGAMRSVIPSLPQWSGFQQLRVTSSRHSGIDLCANLSDQLRRPDRIVPSHLHDPRRQPVPTGTRQRPTAGPR